MSEPGPQGGSARVPAIDVLPLLILGGWFAFLTLASVSLHLLGEGSPAAELGPGVVFPAYLWAQGGAVALMLAGLARYRPGWRQWLGIHPALGRRLRRGFIDFVLVVPLWWAAMLAYQAFVLRPLDVDPEQQAMRLALAGLTDGAPGVVAVTVLATTVGAAVFEELLFRGLLFGWLRGRLPFQVSALGCGLLFGLVHLEGGLPAGLLLVPPLALLGYLLCWVRERSGGLPACIVVHTLYNATSLGIALGFAEN